MSGKNTLSLFEVSQKISNALQDEFPGTQWVIGEISEIKQNVSGHCYLELVEKDTSNDYPKAKARGTIWARTYRMIKPYFETATGRRLQAGLKVLVQCTVNYHPVYGLSLNIVDIDPTFTLGDIELMRQQTINKLIAEGVMDMNKELELPLLPKNIAIISSPTAAGFEDFANQLTQNPYGYVFNIKLFTATMQGDKAEESIIMAMDRIYSDITSWDVLVIIRGGGSQVDLGCFDSYNLANNIAQFPLPVVTGIGHEKDVTVTDMVAHTRQKTPTAVAEFLIAQFVNAENWLIEANDNFTDAVKLVTVSNVQALSRYSSRLFPAVIKVTQLANSQLQRGTHKGHEAINKTIAYRNTFLQRVLSKTETHAEVKINRQQGVLNQMQKQVKADINSLLQKENRNTIYYEKNAKALDPINILKRGFSITIHKGKVLKSSDVANAGDKIETILANGKLVSTIKDKSN
jgi:exodeoxyribonuclease VII large subunit